MGHLDTTSIFDLSIELYGGCTLSDVFLLPLRSAYATLKDSSSVILHADFGSLEALYIAGSLHTLLIIIAASDGVITTEVVGG